MSSNEERIKRKLGEDLFRRVISSILLAQAQIVRTLNLPVGGAFITFSGDSIIWSISGANISPSESRKILSRKDLLEIKNQAISSLKKGQKINGKDLRKLNITMGNGDTIIIRASSKKYTKYIAPEKGPNHVENINITTDLEIKDSFKLLEWIKKLFSRIKGFLSFKKDKNKE